MRHRRSGRQLGRTRSHRVALRRNMAASLIEHEAIRTTTPKAKELRRFIEKLVTLAKKGTLHARRLVIARLQDRGICDADGEDAGKTVVQKLFDEIAPRYADRPGGYTRIVRLHDRRIGDAGQEVLLQLVEEFGSATAEDRASSRRRSRAERRHEAVAATGVEAAPQQRRDEPDADGEAATQAVEQAAEDQGDEGQAPEADEQQQDAQGGEENKDATG